jgi:transcription antitermination factor NusG
MSSLKWYVLNCHSWYEEVLSKNILSQGFESYYPYIRVHPVNPRAHVARPYFPGYIFVRLDLASVGVNVFNSMPYSNGLVSFGGEPAVLADVIVDSISRNLEEINRRTNEGIKKLKQGQQVTIESGVFSGYDASFLYYLSGSQRARVLLMLLSQGRYVSVDLPLNQIKPIENN